MSGIPISETSPCGNCSFTRQLFAPALSCSAGLAPGIVNSNYTLYNTGNNARIWDAKTYSDNWTASDTDGYGSSIAIRYRALTSYSDSPFDKSLSCTVTNASYTVLSNFMTSPGVTSVLNRTREDWWPATVRTSM